jgi:hypothetical protein
LRRVRPSNHGGSGIHGASRPWPREITLVGASRPVAPVARLEPTLRVGSNACATMTPEPRIARTP